MPKDIFVFFILCFLFSWLFMSIYTYFRILPACLCCLLLFFLLHTYYIYSLLSPIMALSFCFYAYAVPFFMFCRFWARKRGVARAAKYLPAFYETFNDGAFLTRPRRERACQSAYDWVLHYYYYHTICHRPRRAFDDIYSSFSRSERDIYETFCSCDVRRAIYSPPRRAERSSSALIFILPFAFYYILPYFILYDAVYAAMMTMFYYALSKQERRQTRASSARWWVRLFHICHIIIMLIEYIYCFLLYLHIIFSFFRHVCFRLSPPRAFMPPMSCFTSYYKTYIFFKIYRAFYCAFFIYC